MDLAEFESTITEGSARITACVYGPPKVGKTEAIGKLATAGFKLHWFDLENGYETLLKLPASAKKNITLYKIPDTRGMPMAIETMLKVIKGAKITVCRKHGKADPIGCPICRKDNSPIEVVELGILGPHDIVVVDSASQLTDSAISHTIKNAPEDYKMQQDDWGNVGKLLASFFSYVQAGRFHTIVTAHTLDPVAERDKTGKLVPSIGTRNFALNSAKYFGHVVYLDVKNRKHVASSGTTDSTLHTSGSRTDVDLNAMGPDYALVELFKHFVPKAPA